MRLDWRGALGIAISVALLAYVLRNVSPHEVWEVLRGSNVGLFVLSALVATLPAALRAARWQVILEPIGRFPFGPLWRSTAIGMMVNNVVPARAGELARAYAVSREVPQVNFSAALGSLVVDRIVDAVVVLGLMFVATASAGLAPETQLMGQPVSRFVGTFGLMSVAALGLLIAMAFAPDTVVRLFHAVVSRVAPRAAERGESLLRSLLGGLESVRSPGRLARVLAWATLLWLVGGLSFWIGFRAVGIEVSFAAALLVQSLIALGVAVPSSPGFFGVFEAAAVAGLALFGVPERLSISFAIGYHILSFIPITVIGMYYFLRMGLHFRDLGQTTPNS